MLLSFCVCVKRLKSKAEIAQCLTKNLNPMKVSFKVNISLVDLIQVLLSIFL
jgi:hypothetical protein